MAEELATATGARLREAGLGLKYIAAVCEVSAGCVVHVGVVSLGLRSVDGSSIRIVQAQLILQDPDEAAFLAAVLHAPAVGRRTAEDDWLWRGWLIGDRPHTPLLSVTLTCSAHSVQGPPAARRANAHAERRTRAERDT